MSGPHDDLRPDGRHAVADALLREHFAPAAGEDLTANVLARASAGQGVEAAAQADAAQRGAMRSRGWAAAALLLLGVGVVTAVALTRGEGGDVHGSPGPGERILVRDPDELRKLLPEVVALRVEVLTLGGGGPVVVGQGVDVSGVPVTATAADRDALVASLRTARLEPPTGWDWQNRMQFTLASGDWFEMAVHERRGARLILGLRGLHGDLSLAGEAAARAEELIAAARRVARMAHGVVLSPADLVGVDAFPPQTEELRLFGVADADLEHLQRFAKLRRLDASGLARTIGNVGFDAIGRCRTLEELSLAGADFPDLAILYLTKLDKLRQLDLSRVRSFTGDGFRHYTLSSWRRDGPYDFILSGVTLSPEGLHALATWGPSRVILQDSATVREGEAWRALLVSERLRHLDLSGCGQTPAQMRELADSTLETLALARCRLDDAALLPLAVGQAPLQRLDLRDNPALTTSGVRPLLDRPTLRHLDVRGCAEVDVAALRTAAGDRVELPSR